MNIRPTRRPPRAQAGMTLLEMMIAMLLLSMVLLLLYGGLHLASRAWSRSDSFTDQVTRMQLVQSFLRREIASVYPYRIRDNANQPRALFLGYEAGPTTLQFVAPMPAAGGHGGLYALRIGLAEEQGAQGADHALMLWRAPAGAPTDNTNTQSTVDDGGDPANAPLTLVDHVRTAKFSYYGTPDTATQPTWYESWPDTTQAPQLVRLKLVLDNGQAWPDMIVALRIDPQAALSH